MPIVRVLQYRSVAFVTYVSELSAQFAKESMACQSMDNDEILNVRWATEDPNPTSKVAEKRRLEDMGQEAIKARMDPRIVDAMRSVRALEEGVAFDADSEFADGAMEEEDEEGEGDADGEPRGKRRRIEAPAQATLTPPESEEEQPELVPQPQGLLSADALEGLKFFAEIRRQNGSSGPVANVRPGAAAAAAPAPRALNQGGGLGLADYGSDAEE